MNDSSDAKSRSRRCHNVWHVPRSNWMRRESTGAHFTLKLANSGSDERGSRPVQIPPRALIDPASHLVKCIFTEHQLLGLCLICRCGTVQLSDAEWE